MKQTGYHAKRRAIWEVPVTFRDHGREALSGVRAVYADSLTEALDQVRLDLRTDAAYMAGAYSVELGTPVQVRP